MYPPFLIFFKALLIACMVKSKLLSLSFKVLQGASFLILLFYVSCHFPLAHPSCSSVTPCYLFPKHSTLFNILCLCFGISNWNVLSFRVWWIPIHFKVITFPDLCSLYQSVQLSLSHVWFFVTQWTAAHQAFLSRRPSPTPGVYSNSCPLSPWCHPTISSSVVCLLLLLSVFPSIKVFSTKSVLPIRWPKY